MFVTKSGARVCPIGLGTNAIGGHNIYPNIDESISKEILRTFFNHGGNFVDTAFFYGWGRSEELIGEVMAQADRDSLFIATKGAHIKTSDGWAFDNSPEFLKQCVKDSLRRLKTDYLDLFYIHFPDEHTNKSESIAALSQLKEQGLIRLIGVSNFSLDQLKEANQQGGVDVVQGHYNLFHQELEGEYSQYLMDHSIAFVPYFPLASGLLTGKYSLDTVLSERQRQRPLFSKENYAKNVEKVEKLRHIAQSKDVEVGQLVLSYYLTLPFVSALIPGAKQPSQVLSNLKAKEITLSSSDYLFIKHTFEG